ncbi:hypothetical protein Tcan_18549 [Toxocara canis]|uniref:Uncharacterized protein n=1 Tax=Toxocara canis TaxID=6265 RepID=A0A0B2VRC2_TOXCA|nr:hypothetical protein Tcan_18549 [Toxocara canis]
MQASGKCFFSALKRGFKPDHVPYIHAYSSFTDSAFKKFIGQRQPDHVPYIHAYSSFTDSAFKKFIGQRQVTQIGYRSPITAASMVHVNAGSTNKARQLMDVAH